jgi:hypothetical protein
MDSFESTNNWIKKTHENMCNEEKYLKKIENNEDTSSFNVKQSRATKSLIPIHNIPKYDATLHNFIIETTQTIYKLNERIAELEEKLEQ